VDKSRFTTILLASKGKALQMPAHRGASDINTGGRLTMYGPFQRNLMFCFVGLIDRSARRRYLDRASSRSYSGLCQPFSQNHLLKPCVV
jgi:hypothetical protein